MPGRHHLACHRVGGQHLVDRKTGPEVPVASHSRMDPNFRGKGLLLHQEMPAECRGWAIGALNTGSACGAGSSMKHIKEELQF